MRYRGAVACGLAALAVLGALPTALGYVAAGPGVMPHGHHRLETPGGVPPLDGLAAASGAYSFRKLKSTYSGPAVRLRRASDNLELDINFLGCTGFTGCPWDSAAATAHCAATTCFVRFLYDQSGNARDLGQATTANQPVLVFDCTGSLPCGQTSVNAGSQLSLQSAATVTPATGVVSLSVVAGRPAGAGLCTFLRENGNGNRVGSSGVANNWTLFGTTGLSAGATDASFHSGIGIVNTTLSLFGIDGVETGGSLTPVMTAGLIGTFGATTATCRVGELLLWDNYVLTPAERAVLVNNQRGFWGF